MTRQAIGLVLELPRPAAVLVAGPRVATVAGGLVGVGLPVIGDHVAVVEGAERQHPQPVVQEAVGHNKRDIRLLSAAQFDVAQRRLAGDEQAGAVKGAAGADIDVAGDGLARHVRGHRLGHHDLAGQRRRDVVEARVATLRADNGQAVERHRRPVPLGSAQVDVAGLALVAFHGDTRQAADGEGDVLVRQAAHRVGGDDADQRGRFFLDQERRSLGFCDGSTGNDHFFDTGLRLGDRIGRHRGVSGKCRKHRGSGHKGRARRKFEHIINPRLIELGLNSVV